MLTKTQVQLSFDTKVYFAYKYQLKFLALIIY